MKFFLIFIVLLYVGLFSNDIISYTYTYENQKDTRLTIGTEKREVLDTLKTNIITTNFYRKFYYDKKGFLIKTETYRKKDEKLLSYISYGYGKNKKINKEIFYKLTKNKQTNKEEAVQQYLSRFIYSEDNNLLERKQIIPPNIRHIRIVNLGNDGLGALGLNKNIKEFKYIHDSSKKLEKIIETKQKKGKKIIYNYEYNYKKNKKTKKNETVVLKKNSKNQIIRTFEYKYDDKGRLDKAIVIKHIKKKN